MCFLLRIQQYPVNTTYMPVPANNLEQEQLALLFLTLPNAVELNDGRTNQNFDCFEQSIQPLLYSSTHPPSTFSIEKAKLFL